jgi:hypothetical protein
MSVTSLFRSFLDGFTGAGLIHKLVVPGEPIIGFAPASAGSTQLPITLADQLVDVETSQALQRLLGINVDESGQVTLEIESASGDVQQIPFQSRPMGVQVPSSPHRHAT